MAFNGEPVGGSPGTRSGKNPLVWYLSAVLLVVLSLILVLAAVAAG